LALGDWWGIDNSFVSRVVNLTTLAPDIVAAILDETLPPGVTLWEEQRDREVGKFALAPISNYTNHTD
jgi:hypothetical protein